MALAVALVCAPDAVAAAQPRPYALPFQLRPAIAPNVLRLESTVSRSGDRWTTVALATAGVRVSPDVSVVGRAAYVVDVPDGGMAQGALGNPSLGVLYTPAIAPGMHLALFGGLTPPLGQGDGLDASSPEVVALASGRVARGSLDNALFATNHVTVAVGLAWLWLVERFSLQLEGTLLGAFRGRGSQGDAAVENLTLGAWVAYAPTDQLFVGVALHHQRFSSDPALVRARGERLRAQTTISLAGRARASVDGIHLNPGIAYTRGLDGAMEEGDHHVVTLELLVQY